MKQALTFTPPILSSTESKLNVEAFDASVEAFENHEYLKSFYALLDYINGDFRTKYGNVQGNEFHIPHGSIIVNIKLDEEKLSFTAPFVALPEKGADTLTPSGGRTQFQRHGSGNDLFAG